MADLIARALGRAALRKVSPERTEKPFDNPRSHFQGEKVMYSKELCSEVADVLQGFVAQEAERQRRERDAMCIHDLAAIVEYWYPELSVSPEAMKERLEKLVRSDNQLSRLRLKYGWHDAAKLLPNHSRHVLVWTQYGEYRAWYDHKWKCWRTRREGLKITHWRERCGPEDWPAAE